MIYTFGLFLDILFPPTEHEKIVRLITPAKIPFYYHEQKINEVISLSDYHRREIQALVASCKFENNYLAAKILGQLLSLWLDKNTSQKTLLIPIPLSSKRQKTRGFNQVEKVLKTIKKLPKNYVISKDILVRIINKTPQTSLHRSARLKNIRGVFAVKKNYNNYLQTFEQIIICDDVLTTGATLYEAKATLLPHIKSNTKIICLTFSH
jgi:ComF family protein